MEGVYQIQRTVFKLILTVSGSFWRACVAVFSLFLLFPLRGAMYLMRDLCIIAYSNRHASTSTRSAAPTRHRRLSITFTN